MQIACLAPGETIVGFVQHPRTGYWQVWISFTGCDIILLTARSQRSEAETDIRALKAVLGSKDYYNICKVTALLKELIDATDEEPQPLPAHLLAQIYRAILRSPLS